MEETIRSAGFVFQYHQWMKSDPRGGDYGLFVAYSDDYRVGVHKYRLNEFHQMTLAYTLSMSAESFAAWAEDCT